MTDKMDQRGAPDRSRISLDEEWEISYWTKELGCSEADLAAAIDAVGNSSEAIRTYLKDPRNAG